VTSHIPVLTYFFLFSLNVEIKGRQMEMKFEHSHATFYENGLGILVATIYTMTVMAKIG